MRPTDILKQEHRVIEQVLACLERIADDCAARGTLDAVSAEQAIDFLRRFGDRCHHGKEEQLLFPMLESLGFPHEGGPTGALFAEHDLGRSYLDAMARSADRAAAGDRACVRAFAANARAYASLLRQHITKEDLRLFPMADEAFSDDEQQLLMESFARVEEEDMGAGTHERYLRLADELADRWGVPRAAPGPGQGHACCCGHRSEPRHAGG